MPQKTYERCIILLLDGARLDVFRRLLREGMLPNIQEQVVGRGSLLEGVTTFPSTTGPAYLPFLTGCYAGTVGVPGIRWLDKQRLGSGKPGWRRSYMGYEATHFNRDFDPSRPTLFEIFERPLNIFNLVTRGLPRRANASRYTRPPLYGLAHFTELWHLVDRAAGWHLLRALKSLRHNCYFAALPAIDAFSHRSHPFEARVIRSYVWADHLVGRAVEVLAQKRALESTLWVLVSDHGLTTTHTHFDLVSFLDRRGFKALDYPRVFRRNPRAAVMISGNAMANVYFKNSRGWHAPTYRQDLDREDDGLLLGLLERPDVDILAIRDYRGGVHVMSRRGAANVAEKDGRIRYTQLAKDPFGYGPMPESLSWDEALHLTADTDYPDAPAQIVQLFRTSRVGDLVISAAKGYDLRANFEWPEHKASHGALLREQMCVPLAFSHPVRSGPARTADVFPTILELMGRRVPEGIDGKSLV